MTKLDIILEAELPLLYPSVRMSAQIDFNHKTKTISGLERAINSLAQRITEFYDIERIIIYLPSFLELNPDVRI